MDLSLYFSSLDRTVQNENCFCFQFLQLLGLQVSRFSRSKLRSLLLVVLFAVKRMEINYGSGEVTTVKQSQLTCAGGALALLVSALVKTQHSLLTQEYMKLVMMQPKTRGDHQTSCPCKAVDAEDGDENGDEVDNGDADGEGEEDLSYEDGNTEKNGANNDPEQEEDGDGEDEHQEDDEDNEDDDDDDDNDDGEEDDGEGGEDNEEEEEEVVEEEDDEEEDEEEEEETLQPPKKRKK